MEKQIGIVSNYFANVKVAAIKLTGPLKVGDKVKVVGGGAEVEQVVKSMQVQHEKVVKARKGNEIGIKLSKKVRKGYKVFRL